MNAILSRSRKKTPTMISPNLIGIPANVRVNNPLEDIGHGEQTTQDEPTIALNDNYIIVAFNDTTLDGGGFCKSKWANYSISSDSGQTFKDCGSIGGITYGNNVVVSNKIGDFFCCTIAADPTSIVDGCQPPPIPMIGVAWFDNNLQAFGGLVNTSGNYSNSQYDFQDKPWLTIDNTGGNYDGRLYLSWVRLSNYFIDSSQATNQIKLVYSADNGKTWSNPVDLSTDMPNSDGHTGPVPIVGPNGMVFVVWLYPHKSQILISRSTDGGQSFSNPVLNDGPVQTISPIPEILNGSFYATSFPSVSIDNNNGTLYVAYSARNGFDQADIFLVKSNDNGNTWSDPIQVNDDGTSNDQWMPSVAVTSNGVIGIIFYDRRNDPNNFDIDLYLALSKDGGRLISSQSTNNNYLFSSCSGL